LSCCTSGIVDETRKTWEKLLFRSGHFSSGRLAPHIGQDTLEFIGIWEELHNPAFKGNEFVTFKSQAGLNSFNLTPRKWIEATNAIGMVSKAGRYGGGTFAHRDIAFESAQIKISILKDKMRIAVRVGNNLTPVYCSSRDYA
jgi:hypothetical protein